MAYGYVRKLVMGLVVGGALFVAAIGMSLAVGAASGTDEVPICINYSTCYDNGTAVANPSGYPANTVVSTYFDPRYCNGAVSIVTDSSGNLINVCAATGQRIYPVYSDYGSYYGGIYNRGIYNGYTPYVYNGGVPYRYFGGAFPYYGGVYNNYFGGLYGYTFGGCGTSIYVAACIGTGTTPSSGVNPSVYNQPVIAPPTGVRVKEVAAPVPAPAPEAAAPAVTTTVSVAPAAPAQNVAALSAQPAATVDAPAALPAQGSGLGTHAQGVAAPTTPAFAPEPTGPDARG